MDKMTEQDGGSLDIVSKNLEVLKTIFPEAFTEDGVDFDTLRQLLGDEIDDGEEKYGLNWHGKKKARQIALTPSTGTLRPCPEESVEWNTTQNLFIEGDNLEVLKLLQKSYAGKVKMIYIDPPYNTGKEFIYPDKFQDNLDTYLKYTRQKDNDGMKFSSNTEGSGRYHTNWLNMMHPRLKLARNLLQDSGAIFISIDDHEIAQAKGLISSIFGEENFVNCLVWKKRYNAAKEKHLAIIHEYVLIYAKNKEHISDFFVPGDKTYFENYFKEEDEYLTTRGRFMTQPLEAGNSMDARPNLRFPLIAPDGTELWPRRQWVWGKEKAEKAHQEGRLKFYQDKMGEWKVRHKQYEKNDDNTYRKVKPFSIYNMSFTQDGTKDMKILFNESSVFPFPKPVKFMSFLLELSNDPDAIVVDFFAGSCSMAQAVLELNKKDEGRRRFLMAQLPEPCDEKSEAFKSGYKTIAEIGKERIRRVAAKIKEENPNYDGDLGFKVFKLDSSNIRAWNPGRGDLEQTLLDHTEHLVEGRSEQDLLYELLLKLNVELTSPIEEKKFLNKIVYSIGYGMLFACLDTAISRDEIEGLGQGIIDWHKELGSPNEKDNGPLVVFRDSAFSDDISKTNMTAILEQHGISHVRSL
jgi:adenine-specific DNA-methyltransferase